MEIIIIMEMHGISLKKKGFYLKEMFMAIEFGLKMVK